MVSQRTIIKLIPVSIAFDASVGVAVFGHYTDPTLQVVGAVSCAITVISMAVIYYRSL